MAQYSFNLSLVGFFRLVSWQVDNNKLPMVTKVQVNSNSFIEQYKSQKIVKWRAEMLRVVIDTIKDVRKILNLWVMSDSWHSDKQ